jgi:dihydrofolate synthase/folylpolyglutamate synthase
VAGTNGKGSVSHMLASVLQEAGFKTGLFTSPHLKDFRERIKVNGLMITEDEVVIWFENHKEIIDKVKPSFFEMTSAMAFDYFNEREVDFAIIETGLGGRLDSTNIITPVLSVITNIGLDHTDLLGDSLEKIAFEKAGIIKNRVQVIVGETHSETQKIFEEQADEMLADIVFADQIYKIERSFLTANQYRSYNVHVVGENSNNVRVVYEGLKTQLMGKYQEKNVITVLAVIDNLRESGIEISDHHLFRGLRNVVSTTGLLGRWQVFSEKPYIVCDTGHNADGIKQVVKQIKSCKYKKLYIVLGLVADKDIESVLQLLPTDAVYFFTKANIPRALNEELLKEKSANYNLRGNCYRSVPEAYKAAKAIADDEDMIFVGGSTFVVAEVI